MNNSEDIISSEDEDNDHDDCVDCVDCVDEHWDDEIISAPAPLLSPSKKGNVHNSVKENNSTSSNDEYNCDEHFQDEILSSTSTDNKDESYHCRNDNNNDEKYNNFCSGLHDCPHVHIDADCCRGYQKIIEIVKEISIEQDFPKFSIKIYKQIRKRLMKTSETKTKTKKKKQRSSKKNDKGKQELLFFQYECNNDERSHTESINNSDRNSETNKNKNRDTNNNIHDVYELDTCDLIYDAIRPIYLGERYMMKHAYKHDVYFEYPDHPGTKAFVRAVQQVISGRIRDTVNGTSGGYLNYHDSDHDAADDQDYGRDNDNDNDNNTVDDIENNNNNNERNNRIGTYRQIKDKLYDSKFFIGKAPYCIQAKKSIRNIIFKARYESDTAQTHRHIKEQNELDKLKVQQQLDKARPIPGMACKWWFKRMLPRMFAKVFGCLYTCCSSKMSRCKQRSSYELWLFYNEITLSYYGAPYGGRLKGPMLFLLGCAFFVFIFGMTYMIFKFIAIDIFDSFNVSISFAPRIVDFFKDDDDIEI